MKTHIVFNLQLFNDLKKLLPGDNHLFFPYKLSTGKISNLEDRNTKGIERKIYNVSDNLLTESYNKLNVIGSSNDSVVIWYSHEANDYCNFLFLLDFLPIVSKKVNCSQHIRFNEGYVIHENSSSLSFEEVQYLLNCQEKVTLKEKVHLLEGQWQKNKNSEQRIFKKGNLLSLNFSFLDSLISQSILNGYTTNSEIVFSVREIFDFVFPDQVILGRLKSNI